MIGLFTKTYYLKIPGTDGLCYFPEVTFKIGKDRILRPYADKIDSLMFLGILMLFSFLEVPVFTSLVR